MDRLEICMDRKRSRAADIEVMRQDTLSVRGPNGVGMVCGTKIEKLLVTVSLSLKEHSVNRNMLSVKDNTTTP